MPVSCRHRKLRPVCLPVMFHSFVGMARSKTAMPRGPAYLQDNSHVILALWHTHPTHTHTDRAHTHTAHTAHTHTHNTHNTHTQHTHNTHTQHTHTGSHRQTHTHRESHSLTHPLTHNPRKNIQAFHKKRLVIVRFMHATAPAQVIVACGRAEQVAFAAFWRSPQSSANHVSRSGFPHDESPGAAGNFVSTFQ